MRKNTSPTIVLGPMAYRAMGNHVLTENGEIIATATGPSVAAMVAAALNADTIRAKMSAMYLEYDHENMDAFDRAFEDLRKAAGIPHP